MIAVTSRAVAQGEYPVGHPIRLVVTIENPAETTQSYTAVLLVNGSPVDSTNLIVPGGSTREAELSWTPTSPGTYELKVVVQDESGAEVKVETYRVEVVPPPRPDLSLLNLTLSGPLEPGGSVEVRATVANLGDAESPPTEMLVVEFPTDRVIYSEEVGPLRPGEEAVISFEYTAPAEPGDYSLVVILDPENAVEESDEENTFEFGISVPPAPAPSPTEVPPTESPTPTPPPSETGAPTETPTSSTPPPSSPTQAPPTTPPTERGLERYAYAVGLLTAVALLLYGGMRLGGIRDPCRDMGSLRTALDLARKAKSRLLDDLERVREEAEQISRQISQLEKEAGSAQERLASMWKERDQLRLGRAYRSYAAIVGKGRAIVRVHDKLKRLTELEEEIKELEESLARTRAEILEKESALNEKVREVDALWSLLEEANRRLAEVNDLIYQCLLKKRGPCYDLDLLRSRVAELERELEALKALASLSEADAERIDRFIRQTEAEIASQLKMAEFWESEARRMAEGKPKVRISVSGGPEFTDIDFRLIEIERGRLVAQFARGEISESEFIQAYESLSHPTEEVVQRLRKKARDVASKLEDRAREARERAKSLETQLPELKRAKESAEARTEALRGKIRSLSESVEEARKRLEKCEKKVRDCLSNLVTLREEIRWALNSYEQRRARLIEEARREIEAVNRAVDEVPELVGRIQRLAIEIKEKVDKIRPVLKLEELSPKFQEILEEDWNAFTYGKTGASIVKNVTQLLKDIGAKADSILPDPSDYLEPAVKGVAFVYRAAGVLLSPTDAGAWLYREMRRWAREHKVPSDEEIEEVLEAAERFVNAWSSWRSAARQALESLQDYLTEVSNGQDVLEEWKRFLECLENLPATLLDEREAANLTRLMKDSTSASTLGDCEKYARLLGEKLREIGDRSKELFDRCEEPSYRPSGGIEATRQALVQAAKRLEEISRDLQRYLDSVGSFLQSVKESIPGFIRALFRLLS